MIAEQQCHQLVTASLIASLVCILAMPLYSFGGMEGTLN